MPFGARAGNGYWQDWVNLVLGVWLFVAPWVLAYADLPAAAWNSWVFGVIVAVISIAALISFAPWKEWVNVILGVWVLISPWVMLFAVPGEEAATWNHVVVGLAIAVLALWEALSHRTRQRAQAPL